MAKLNINPYDNGRVMTLMSELLEEILNRPISELEQPEKVIDDARAVIKAMRGEYLRPASGI